MPSPPSTYHQYGAGPRVYTRDDRADRKIWKERLLESARFRDDLIGRSGEEGRKFIDGRQRTAAVVGDDGQNIHIDLTNTKVIVDPETKRNLYRDETTRKTSPQAQKTELDLDNRPKSSKVRGSVRHIHERSEITPLQTKPQPHLLRRGKYNSTHQISDRNGAYHKDDEVIASPRKCRYSIHRQDSSVFAHLFESATGQNNNKLQQDTKSNPSGKSIEIQFHHDGTESATTAEVRDATINHAESLKNKDSQNASRLGYSPSAKVEDTRTQARSKFDRPYNFRIDAILKRRVPHEETHFNIFHEDKDFTVYDMDPKDTSIGARKKRANFHLNQKHHFIHHSNEDHINSGTQVSETAVPKRRLGKHHHFVRSSALDCHPTWQGTSDSTGFDESHETTKIHNYDHGHDTSKNYVQPPGGTSGLEHDMSPSPAKESRIKHKRVKEPPGGVDSICLEDLSLSSSRREKIVVGMKQYTEHDGSRDDHITSELSTKDGAALERHDQTKHFEQIDHITSTFTETDASLQHSSKYSPHASQRHFEVNRGNQDHISSGGGEVYAAQRRHQTFGYGDDHLRL